MRHRSSLSHQPVERTRRKGIPAPGLVLRGYDDDTAIYRLARSRMSSDDASPAKMRMNRASICSRRSRGSDAYAKVSSRPAKHERRFDKSAHDRLTGHGVTFCKNRGLLAIRSSGAACRRTAAHMPGVRANNSPSALILPTAFSCMRAIPPGNPSSHCPDRRRCGDPGACRNPARQSDGGKDRQHHRARQDNPPSEVVVVPDCADEQPRAA